MARDRDQVLGRTISVLHHGVTDAGLVRKMFSGVGKERGDGLFALQGFHEGFCRLREDGLLSALGDHLIGISGEHGQDFRAIRGRQMRSARANCDFTLAWSAACAKVIENFRAEGFHRMPASNLSGSALLYRRLRVFQRAAWLARSIPATPPRNRPRSLQTAGWGENGGFFPREVPHQAAPRRRRGCALAWQRKWKRQDPEEPQPKKLSCQTRDQRR